jgi:hypothetical protein
MDNDNNRSWNTQGRGKSVLESMIEIQKNIENAFKQSYGIEVEFFRPEQKPSRDCNKPQIELN